MSTSKLKQPYVLTAAAVARAHTILATLSFSSAFLIGSFLHYKKIVKNDVARYPEEWFPSVSATIGDWYPERNIFQLLIALTSGPRFALVALQYFLHRSQSSSLPTVVFASGIIRTLSCGGWVYITSSDDHDVHDIAMITYMLCNIPWMLGGINSTPVTSTSVRRKRTFVASAFFGAIIPLLYYFIQHKVHRIPGAYTRYAFFEWGLIIFDVLYDSVAEQEFKEADLQVSVGSLLSKPIISDHADQIVKVSVTEIKAGQDVLKAADQALADAVKTALAPAPIHKTKQSSLTFLLPTASFLSDVYLSYIFWSIFTSLIPTLFYFSIWELGIAGQELALLSTLSPILFAIPPILKWAQSRDGQVVLNLLSFSGLAAYTLDKPVERLFVVGFANIVLVMRQVAQWVGVEGQGSSSGYQGIVTGLGLLLSSLSKHANHTNNPVWPFINAKSGGYNKIGLTLAVLAVIELYVRPAASDLATVKAPVQKAAEAKHTSSKPQVNWLSGAIPLGSLLFCLHNLLAESSTLIAWSWTGYENGAPRGPVPHLHGALTLVVQSLGLLIPVYLSSLNLSSDPLAHPLWFVYGCASAYVMYAYRNWVGYCGGLGHALFLMSIIPSVVQKASASSKVTRTYSTAFLVYCLLNLASIFTVAYAFVPGGNYFRERTNAVTAVQVALLFLAFRKPSTPSVTSYNISKQKASYTKTLLACISILSVLVTMYHVPATPPIPAKPGPRIVNAGIWTIHFGFDNEGHDSQRGVRNLIRDMELDIVGLLETDLHRTSFGHRDLARVAVEDLGYNVDIGPGPNLHTWGCVLLTKFPIINTTHHLLPSPRGELAPAIEAVLDIYGTEVTVIVSHNGQEEDPLDRELQSTELARIMSSSPRPVIFLGYVVTKPHAERPNPYEIMVSDGNVHDIDADDMDRWCEYIFYRGLYRTAYARVSRGIITDTEMQIGQFVLPKHGTNVTDDSVDARYLRSKKEELPADHWFPMSYYGDENQGGVDGHFYHVFGTPLYYKLPESAIV